MIAIPVSATPASLKLLVRIGRRKTGVSRHRASVTAGVGMGVRRYAARVFLVAILFAVVLSGYRGIIWLQHIEVGAIEFYGYSGTVETNRGVSRNELQQLVAPYLHKKFWRLDLLQLQSDLERHPWVRSATVRRDWPDQLRVGIDEHVPIARWNANYLLTATGTLIEDADALLISSLPRFSVTQNALVSEANVRSMVARYNKLQKQFARNGQQIIEVGIAGANDVTVKLASGSTIKLGDAQHGQRLNRLVDIMETQVNLSWEKIAVADLRYSSGIAVRWVDAEIIDDEIESLLPIAQRDKAGPKLHPSPNSMADADITDLVVKQNAGAEV